MVVKSDLTTAQYNRVLGRLRTGLSQPLLPAGTAMDTPEALTFLLDPTPVQAYVEDPVRALARNTQKAYYTAILSRVRAAGAADAAFAVQAAAALARYEALFRGHREALEQQALKQELTPREQAKFLSWEEVLAVRDTLQGHRTESLAAFQDYVILCLYTMVPPKRLDFTPMMVVQRKPREPDSGMNYLIIRSRTADFLFNAYKTADSYGAQTVPVPAELHAVLAEWLRLNRSGFLLVKQDGSPMSEDLLSKRIMCIFEREAGKAASNSTMRKAYVTWRRGGEMPLLEKAALARDMMHSASTAELHYLKTHVGAGSGRV